MTEKLYLKDIHLGSTDAKNEVLSGSPDEIARFMDSYVTPPALVIDKFMEKKKYFVVGLKGTGKTALLRYISLKLEQDNAVSTFVLFKSQVDEDLRKDFAKAARVHQIQENTDSYDTDDYETVWRWFIYRKIAESIKRKYAEPFQENSNLARFIALVDSEAIGKQSDSKGLMKLVPSIRKGNIEISNSPKLGFEFDWDENGRAKVNFNDMVRRADSAFQDIQPGNIRLNIFFDELEISYATNKQYQRDCRLIRDLIVSIEKINASCKEKGFPLCLYAAVRSEVLVSVSSLGKEINKPIADFGSLIIWNRPGLSAEQQPLLTIIEKRINNARKEHNLPVLNQQSLWSEYFPSLIHDKNPQIYILHNSWYRPRDVIRLLLTVQDQYPEDTSFNIQGLEAVRKIYSSAAWVELTEELKTKYKPSEINGIKYIFYGFKQVCTLSEISYQAEKVAVDHEETKDLLGRINIKEILKDLYRIGIIGNIDKKNNKMRFSFRGDDEIIFGDNIFVHNALKSHLSI